MEYENGEIIRYAQVNFGFGYPSWYIDLDDEVEQGDMVIAPYRHQEQEGIVTQVVRCVYPYVVYPAKKTLPIFEITKRKNQP